MKRSHQPSLILFGIPSLFLIFTVVSMMILSLMAYGASRTDLRESEESYTQTAAYYTACEAASEAYEQLLPTLKEIYEAAPTEEAYLMQMPLLAGDSLIWQEDTKTFSLMIPFSEKQALSVLLIPEYTPRLLSIGQWSTLLTEDWSSDNTLPVVR